ncbi:hypothetical protein GCM10020256_02850 [Streptomyces thermocoprophilus]
MKGLGAAPFVAATGSLLTATTAEAATIDAGQFALTHRTANSHGEYAALNAGLATKLTKVDAATVLADTNRNATRLTSAPGTVDAFAAGFTWESGDRTVDYWIPQGITTSADAYGSGLYPSSGGKKAIIVSWYFETDPDGDGTDEYALDKGVRLSFVDMTNAAAPTYRHVLLVEPVKTSSGACSFNPVRRHAGGIMWYGNLLYVVDTYKGLRVFDLNTMFRVATAEKDVCGLHTDGKYYGYSYAYVLPQCAAYDNTGKYLRYSAVGLDRAGTPDSLVVSEYSVSGTVDHTGSYSGTGAPHRHAQGGPLEPRLHEPADLVGDRVGGRHGRPAEDPGCRLAEDQALPGRQQRIVGGHAAHLHLRRLDREPRLRPGRRLRGPELPQRLRDRLEVQRGRDLEPQRVRRQAVRVRRPRRRLVTAPPPAAAPRPGRRLPAGRGARLRPAARGPAARRTGLRGHGRDDRNPVRRPTFPRCPPRARPPGSAPRGRSLGGALRGGEDGGEGEGPR